VSKTALLASEAPRFYEPKKSAPTRIRPLAPGPEKPGLPWFYHPKNLVSPDLYQASRTRPLSSKGGEKILKLATTLPSVDTEHSVNVHSRACVFDRSRCWHLSYESNKVFLTYGFFSSHITIL